MNKRERLLEFMSDRYNGEVWGHAPTRNIVRFTRLCDAQDVQEMLHIDECTVYADIDNDTAKYPCLNIEWKYEALK